MFGVYQCYFMCRISLVALWWHLVVAASSCSSSGPCVCVPLWCVQVLPSATSAGLYLIIKQVPLVFVSQQNEAPNCSRRSAAPPAVSFKSLHLNWFLKAFILLLYLILSNWLYFINSLTCGDFAALMQPHKVWCLVCVIKGVPAVRRSVGLWRWTCCCESNRFYPINEISSVVMTANIQPVGFSGEFGVYLTAQAALFGLKYNFFSDQLHDLWPERFPGRWRKKVQVVLK